MENNQDRKRVLIFSTAYLPLVGGAEIAVKEITDRLPDWHFDMITARIKSGLADCEKIGNVNVYRIGFGCGFDKFLLPVWGLWKARKLDYDFIWSIMASQAGVAASFLKMLSGRKMLLTLQEGDLESHLERYALGSKFLYRLLIKPWHLLPLKKADRVQAISCFLAQRATNNGYRRDVDIIPNGVDMEKFKRLPEERIQEVKNKLGVKSNEKVIFTVSRLVYKNGIDDLIKAGRYLEFPFKILIAGTGKEEKNLRALADDKVLFLGNVSQNDLPKYYSLADVFVRASRSEGFGISFLEAMACEVPFIAPAVGGIKDFLRDGVVGYECQVDNPESIAEQIKRALKERNIRAGLELVKEKYMWYIVSEQMKTIFNKLTC